MSSNIKSFSMKYYHINKGNIFTSGDHVKGRIKLELEKECKIDSLCVKLKGKAEVKWKEKYGQIVIPYYNKEKYFSIKQFLIEDGKGKCSNQNCFI